MEARPKYYFPQLDSIRGLSFLAVFFFHAWHPHFGAGFFGRLFQYGYDNLFLSIDVFFILSSFLLTWLGINEYKVKGNFSFINYFIRRVLRIWPLYYLLMIFSFIVLPYASSALQVPVTLPPASYYLFFFSNFYLEGHVYFLRFLWTLSVEEQFYLLWGICLLLFQKQIMLLVLIFVIVSAGYTIYAIDQNIFHDFNTLTYLFDFAVGILAAWLLHKKGRVARFFENMTMRGSAFFLCLLPAIFVIIFLISDNTPSSFSPWLDLSLRYLFVTFIGAFIMEQMVNTHTAVRLGMQRFLVYTGKISYGLYCFHGIVLTFGLLLLEKLKLSMPAILQALFLLAINFMISAISYRFIERPFLKLKDKMRRA